MVILLSAGIGVGASQLLHWLSPPPTVTTTVNVGVNTGTIEVYVIAGRGGGNDTTVEDYIEQHRSSTP